jgi:polysaccharide biosynthesis transport protein
MASGSRDSAGARSAVRSRGLARYYQTVLEHWRLVIGCVVVTLAAAVIYVVLTPKTYQAEAQMLVAPVSSDNTALVGLPVLHATSDPTRDVLTATTLITTPQIAAGVIQALHLSESPTKLLQKVTAVPVGQSNLVAIQATASSARRAQVLANEFAHQVVVTRSAALRTAVANVLPGLKAQLATVPPADRTGVGSLGDQVQQLEQMQAGGDPTITFASPATLPSGPSSPKTKLALLAGLIGGLIIGIGAAFAFDAFDPRLRREQQLRELFDLPVLARMPREPLRREQPLLPGDLSFGATEAFRTLRAMVTSRGSPRAVLVTGSSTAEGKTTTAINLAAALAQGGSHVILIEADLRRPSIAAALQITPKTGTEDVLVNTGELDEALTPVSTDDALVAVLPVRRSSEHLADRLTFAAARRLIGRAKELADFVVVDAPPLTAVIDALPFAEAVDDILIVARIGSSNLNRLSQLNELLLDQGTAPTGFVVVGDSSWKRDAGAYYRPTGEAQGTDGERAGMPRDGEPVRTAPRE